MGVECALGTKNKGEPNMTTARILLAAALLAAAPWGTADNHSAAELRKALADSSRSDADKARDEGRKPAEVIAFLGFEEGDSVMDAIAAGGWYTEVLAVAVGPDGRVYAQNPPAVLQFRDGANDKELTARLANGRLPNVERLDGEFTELDIPAGSLDGAITALNIHDVYNRGGEQATVGVLQTIKTLLKPGAVLGIIDHVGVPGADNAALHRIEKAKVVAAAQAAGFEVAGDSDVLANPGDDHTQMVFADELRGHTDRFLLKLKNPG
jgi:predicted methyltransferase